MPDLIIYHLIIYYLIMYYVKIHPLNPVDSSRKVLQVNVPRGIPVVQQAFRANPIFPAFHRQLRVLPFRADPPTTVIACCRQSCGIRRADAIGVPQRWRLPSRAALPLRALARGAAFSHRRWRFLSR